MLGSSFTAIGIGRAYNANSQYKWYWTTQFGSYSDGYTAPAAPTATPRLATPTPRPSQPPASQPCGDVTSDGLVNIQDILFVVSRYMLSDEAADFDGSGEVGIPDVLLVVLQFGQDC
jgi:hypothetical protein